MNLPAPAVALPTTTRRDWQEALALLDTALDLDTGSHAGWLAGLGPEQARLAPLLESLLRSHASRDTGDFMQTPAISALAQEPQTAPPGSEG